VEGEAGAEEGVWIYINTNVPVGDREHVKQHVPKALRLSIP
jgi:hypothetical protein